MSENPEEEVFQILKEEGNLTAEEVQDVLGDYGYDNAGDSLAGRRFLRNCGWTAGGAVVLYFGYTVVVLHEKRRHKKEMEEQSKKAADGIARIREGDSLPSVRQLADHISINMHTVNKAYAVLRQEGFVKLDRRRGAVVSLESDKRQALEEMKNEMAVAMAKGICKGVSREEIHRLVDEMFDLFLSWDKPEE